MLLLAAAHPLVHVNASLNCLATFLLVIGFVLIKCRNEQAHKWVMLMAFSVSAAFLVCYVIYHATTLHTPFTLTGIVRYVYYTILVTHVILAMTVPFLAIRTILLGLRASQGDVLSRERHRRWARITFPIWLYVSITGVIVYVMLYHL